jgi:WD40 repeat protein
VLVEVPVSSRISEVVAVSDSYLAWIGEDGVHAYSLAGRQEVVVAQDWQGRVEALAIEDHSAQLAVAGWFDEVVVYDLGQGRSPVIFALPGQCHGLSFLPDYPTLVISKLGRIALWRRGSGVIQELAGPGGGTLAAGLGDDGLLMLDAGANKLLSFHYSSLPVVRRVEVSLESIWTMAASNDGALIFAGSADGQLHRYHVGNDRLDSIGAHSQGLTSILYRGGQLITGADDKTIAIWDAETLGEINRSQAHEFLVNFLLQDEASGTVWSSSSDRTLKSWSWPGLEQQEVVHTGAHANAAFWLDSEKGLGVVGTWGGEWLELRRQQQQWSVKRRVATRSYGIYSVAHQPGVDLVVMVGIQPTDLWVYDLVSEHGARLADPDLNLFWAAAVGKDSVVVVGDASVAVYRFERRNGRLHYQVRVGLSSALGYQGIVADLPAHGWIATGGVGNINLLDLSQLPPAPIMSGQSW